VSNPGAAISSTLCPTLIRLAHNLAPPLIRRRTPFANVFDVTMTACADFLLIESAHADAR